MLMLPMWRSGTIQTVPPNQVQTGGYIPQQDGAGDATLEFFQVEMHMGLCNNDILFNELCIFNFDKRPVFMHHMDGYAQTKVGLSPFAHFNYFSETM